MASALSKHQAQVLDHARRSGGRVYAADYANSNAPGRGGPARASSAFYRTVRSLVRLGLLRQLKHERHAVQGWEVVGNE